MYTLLYGFTQAHDKSVGNLGESRMSLPEYLARPPDRINEYINILKDFMRYRYHPAKYFTCYISCIDAHMTHISDLDILECSFDRQC